MRGCLRPSRQIAIAGVALLAAVACACGRRTLVVVDPDRCADGGVVNGVPGCAPPGLQNELVGYWRLDDGTGTMAHDWSGFGNNGTLVEFTGASPWTAGRAAGGLAVEATGYVNVEPSASINSITEQVTIAGWIYFEGTVSDYATAASRAIGGTIDQHYHISINSRGEVPAFWIKTEDGLWLLQGPKAVTRQTWVHIAGTYDGTTARLYVDGQPVASQPISGRFVLDTTPVILGGNGNGMGDANVTERFPGKIDEIMLYRRALSATDIAQLYAGALFVAPFPDQDAGARD
jgi:large repetitive protein